MSTPQTIKCTNCGNDMIFLRGALERCDKCGTEHKSHRDPVEAGVELSGAKIDECGRCKSFETSQRFKEAMRISFGKRVICDDCGRVLCDSTGSTVRC